MCVWRNFFMIHKNLVIQNLLMQSEIEKKIIFDSFKFFIEQQKNDIISYKYIVYKLYVSTSLHPFT